MDRKKIKSINKKGILNITISTLILSVFLIIVLILALIGLNSIFKGYKEEISESSRLEGYKQAEQDYARIRAFPILYPVQNQTTNETEMIAVAIPVCSEEFRNNYQTICGGGQ